MSRCRGDVAELFRAAAVGSGDEVERLLAGGADVGARDEVGNTALHVAAKCNPRTEVLGVLLDAGSCLEAKGEHGRTPLRLAAMMNTAEVVEYLVGRGADVGEVDAQSSLLHVVVLRNPAKEVVQMLLDAGAPVNARGMGGTTPLHLAAKINTAEVVEYLVERGADVGEKDDRGCNSLHYAALGNLTFLPNGEVVGAPWNHTLHDTAEVVEYLVGRGADIEARECGETPMQIAELCEQWEEYTALKNSIAMREAD